MPLQKNDKECVFWPCICHLHDQTVTVYSKIINEQLFQTNVNDAKEIDIDVSWLITTQNRIAAEISAKPPRCAK